MHLAAAASLAPDERTNRHRLLLPGHAGLLSLLLHLQLDRPSDPRVGESGTNLSNLSTVRSRADGALHRLCLGLLLQTESQVKSRSGC